MNNWLFLRRDEVLERHAALLRLSAYRKAMLADSQRLLEFVRSCGELITWINAKLQLAYDESYLDPANLRYGRFEPLPSCEHTSSTR